MRIKALLCGICLCLMTTCSGCRVTSLHSSYPPPPEPRDEAARLSARIEEELAIDNLKARAYQIVVGCLHEMGGRFGWAEPDPSDIIVKLEFGVERLELNACGGKSLCCTSGFGNSVKIELGAEAFLSGAMDLDRTAYHEGVHAYIRRRLTPRQYRKIPAWLQEGIAIHLAGQTGSYVFQLIRENSESPELLLVGLEAQESTDQYFEFGLALQFIDGFRGGVQELLRLILAGEDPYGAILIVTGLDRSSFLRDAKAAAAARLKRIGEELPLSYHEGLRCIREKDLESAMSHFEQVLADAGIDTSRSIKPDEIVKAGIVPMLALGKWAELASYRSNLKAGAISILRCLLSISPESRLAAAWRLRYSLAYALYEQGDLEEALAEYTRVFRLHHEKPGLQSSATVAITRLLFLLERYDEAFEWIKAYRGSVNLQEINFMKGITLFHLGCQDDGIRLLQKLANGRDKLWSNRAREAVSKLVSTMPRAGVIR